MKINRLNWDATSCSDGYILALSHQGHLDPFCACILIRRPIRWMTRKEFYRHRLCAWLLSRFGAFLVNRQGIPTSSIRRAIELARGGEIVGICPEGGVMRGADSVLRGGQIKKGVCSVALRTGVPILPCVILGTHRLNRVSPWLPVRRGKLWIACGEPIDPPRVKSTRASRQELSHRLQQSYAKIFREMLMNFDLSDSEVA